ncbi:MAG: putative oxidoreductase C-terminal domain-containing protein [Maribacter sp.]|uniref:putative oxidoreductase C-terminal domain-containing protein n=1 Tax=Maribacter sp. TaxID=1897614 RepID=UPI003C73E735
MKNISIVSLLLLCTACGEQKQSKEIKTADDLAKVKLMTLDPGHFHAALVHKSMYSQVDPSIYVFAPEGPEVEDFLNRIESYNNREELPTSWTVNTYLGDDYLEHMISGKPGNVMVVAGKNSKKIDYILAAVKAGLNVYADKPLVIDPEGFEKLKDAFQIAKENKVLIYDIMTERFESTTALQKLFSTLPDAFGQLIDGSLSNPAISKESVHHFFKYVSGQPLVRPPWFFDVEEEGQGIVDVTTHLVDLVQWEAFPEQIIDTADIEISTARRWPTILTKEEFKKVTGLEEFPEYLQKDVKDGKLYVYSNGEMIYRLNGKYAKVSVIWNFQAPEGTGDTHYSVMQGTKSNLIIKQGKEEDYKPVLYIEANLKNGFEASLASAMETTIRQQFPGTVAEKLSDSLWRINVPDEFKVGHEAHFAQVTENYLKYLKAGTIPDWEVPNMISKYYTTIAALKRTKED